MPAPKHTEPDLVAQAVDVVHNFNPAIQTVDSYAFDRLGDTEAPDAEADAVFLKQVLYGCVRFKAALRVFLTHLYNDLAASVLRADYTLYMVLAYLLLFRIGELGFGSYKVLTKALDPTKNAQLLSYVTDWDRMEGQLTQDWLKVFDLSYIDRVVVGGLKQASEQIDAFCQKLSIKAFGQAKAREEAKAKMGLADVTKKALTVPRPFNLTKPAPRKVPEPTKIEMRTASPRDPHKLTSTASVQQVAYDNAKRLEQMRRETINKYEEANRTGRGNFTFHESRDTLSSLRRQLEEKEAESLQFDASFYKPVPKYPEEGATVRLTAASVLREDALLKQKQAADAQLLRDYEEQLRDSTEFYRWQTQMRQKDKDLIKEQAERKRIYAKESAAAAREALRMKLEANEQVAGRLKEEKALMGEQRRQEDDLRVHENQHLVMKTIQVRETAPRVAMEGVVVAKKAAKEALAQELLEAQQQQERRAAEEAERRREKVLKLKESDVHEKSVQVFDPTESAGIGLLGEMSLLEMKGRLEMNKRREEVQLENTRRDILREKAEKQEDLMSRMVAIKKVRQAASSANRDARQRRKEREKAEEEKSRKERESNNLKLLEELEAKRMARADEMKALAEEEDKRQKEAMYMGRAAMAVEENNFSQLLKGAERVAVSKQRVATEEANKHDRIVERAKAQVELEAKNRQSVKKSLYQAKAEEMKKAKAELVERQKAEMRHKQANFRNARASAEEAMLKTRALNRYADNINKQSVRRARAQHPQTLTTFL